MSALESGVVYQHIETAKIAEGALDQFLAVTLALDVAGNGGGGIVFQVKLN